MNNILEWKNILKMLKMSILFLDKYCKHGVCPVRDSPEGSLLV